MKVWGTNGFGNGEFRNPIGVCVDDENNVYVTDRDNLRVQKFDADGTFILSWTVEGPNLIAFHPDGQIYVYDATNGAIEIADKLGNFQGGFSSGGLLSGMTIDPAGNLWTVVQGLTDQVRKRTSTGGPIASFGDDGTEPGEFFNPSGIQVDERGNIWVSEQNAHRIQVFDSTFTFLALFGKEGRDPGQFKEPSDFVLRPNGRLYVLETEERQVQVLDQSNLPPIVQVLSPDPEKFFTPGTTVTINWNAIDDKNVASINLSYVTGEQLYAGWTPAQFARSVRCTRSTRRYGKKLSSVPSASST